MTQINVMSDAQAMNPSLDPTAPKQGALESGAAGAGGGSGYPVRNHVFDAGLAASGMNEMGGSVTGMVGQQPLFYRSSITGAYSDKMAMGWLGGVGGAQQFQGASGQLLPLLPPTTNRDLESRMASSRGLTTGAHLQTKEERNQWFNPGRGQDTWRDGGNVNVTWTLRNRGEIDPVTGLMGFLANPALRCRASGANPIPAYDGARQGLLANATPPVMNVNIPSYQGGQSVNMLLSNASRTTGQLASRLGAGGGRGRFGGGGKRR